MTANQHDIEAALSADYFNVYVIDPVSDSGIVAKLDGYVIEGLDKKPVVRSYSQFLQKYAMTRVSEGDREKFLEALSPQSLINCFADGRERFELNYNALIDGGLHGYSALYARLNKPGEPLLLAAGFKDIDNIVSIQKREGLSIAYSSVANIFLALFRIDIWKGIYTTIKTTEDIEQFSLPDNNQYEEDMQRVVRNAVKEEDVPSVLQFLDLSTLPERMENVNHISFSFQRKVGGTCRLHFSHGKGKLHHVILAVEIENETEYQQAFGIVASDFQAIFRINLKNGKAKTLKRDTTEAKGHPEYTGDNIYPFMDMWKTYVEEVVHPEDKQTLLDSVTIEKIREHLATQELFTGNYRSLQDGKVHYHQYRFSKEKGTSFAVSGFQNIDKIIEKYQEQQEKEKEYQKEIGESQRSLKEMYSIFAASKMGTARITMVYGQKPTLVADQLLKELFGIKGKELTPEETYSHWFTRIEPSYVPSVLAFIEQLKQGGSHECTYLWNHPELGKRYVRSGGTAIAMENGYAIRGYYYDANEVVKARLEQEAKLSEAMEKTRQHSEVISALANIYTTIFDANVDTHEYEVITSVEMMGKLAGRKGNFDDVKEKIISAFMAKDMQEKMRSFLDLNTVAQRMKGTNTISTEYQDPEGRWFQARFIAKNKDDGGNVKSILYVARNITAEKMKEFKQQEQLELALAAAQQSSKAKSTFLNSMSHDIRTPMNAIIGFTALAQTHIENRDLIQDYLSKISTSSTHLLSLINDILDMSRIESGTVKLDEKPLHLPELLHDLRTMIQGLINAKNQNLYIDTQDVKNEDVITDQLRLNQVLINIVGNAIKYTQVGGDVIIRLIEKPCSIKHYATYEFSVKDNGIGMSEEFIGHIFDTFSREHSSTVSGIQGTGLGMAITKNIVDMMGGTIQVESKLGKGSLFTVTLNLRMANETVIYKPIPDLLSARALVVDDDINTCRSVCKMLRDIEMRPEWTVSGKEAVLRAQDAAELKDEYKVYIIDYLMPDMNGIEVVRRIRKVIGDDVPIIVLTAYDWRDFEKEAREAGVTAFVSKPIFMSELRSVLTKPTVSTKSGIASQRHYNFSGKHILLVEDNDLNREIATALLEEIGVTIDHAKDGIEAVEMVDKAPADKYDLVLMDIQMPRMDGYTATREIRTLADNRKANIPIVAMTANAFEEDRQKAIESGMNGHIIKPISIKAIAKVFYSIFGEESDSSEK